MEFSKQFPSARNNDPINLGPAESCNTAFGSSNGGQISSGAATQLLNHLAGASHFGENARAQSKVGSSPAQNVSGAEMYANGLRDSLRPQATELVRQDIEQQQGQQIRHELCEELTQKFMEENGF